MKKISWIILVATIFFSLFMVSANRIEEKLIIGLDAGHGGMDGGASIGEVKEADLTLAIALKTKEVLEAHGFFVVMTRENEHHLCKNEFVKKEDMLKRVNILNTSNAILGLSIHLNKFNIERYSGSQVFYGNTNSLNSLLAEIIQKNLILYLKNTDRKIVKRDNIFLLNRVSIPCCIVECGFMSNPKELELLQTESYQYKLAYALLYGIEDYLKLY